MITNFNKQNCFRTNKFSLVSIEALINLGVKYDELTKICSHSNIEWLNSYIKGKCHLVAREYKEAVANFKNLDSEFMHKSTEILSSLGTSHYLNGDYLNSVSAFEKVKLEN